jgi:hypothetical protein
MSKIIKNAKKQVIDGSLFIPGVFKTDCVKIENTFHDRLLNVAENNGKIYDKIPMVFTDLESWPKSTNLLCWNCKRCIRNRPWFEPQSIDSHQTGKAGVFVKANELNRGTVKNNSYCINVRGIFCSPNCVVRYIYTNARDMAERLNKIAMLLFVFEIFTGSSVQDIQPAPSFTEMLQYGGNLTEQEYQKKLDDMHPMMIKQDNINFVNNCKIFFSRLVTDEGGMPPIPL